MKIFRYKADRVPVLLFTLLFVIDLTLFFTVEDKLIIFLWFVLTIYLKGNICAWNHHHQHVATFRSTFLNRLLEIIYGFQTGATAKAWTLHHVLGHHQNYLDQSKDESRWMRPDGKTMGVLEYIFKVTATIHYRIYLVGKKHPRVFRTYTFWLGIQLLILSAFYAINWYNAFFLFGFPMVVGLTLTVWATYDHHSDLDTKNELEGSRNIIHPFYNLMTGNLGYHTAHHIKQGVHWSLLPALHEEIADKIPDHCFIEPGAPYSWFRPKEKTVTA